MQERNRHPLLQQIDRLREIKNHFVIDGTPHVSRINKVIDELNALCAYVYAKEKTRENQTETEEYLRGWNEAISTAANHCEFRAHKRETTHKDHVLLNMCDRAAAEEIRMFRKPKV